MPGVGGITLEEALADLEQKGIQVGDRVTVSWSDDQRWQMGKEMSVTGILAALIEHNGWFEIVDTGVPPGHLRSSIKAFNTRIEKAAPVQDNPFLKKARKGHAARQLEPDDAPKTNPFILKSLEKEGVVTKVNPFLAKSASKEKR